MVSPRTYQLGARSAAVAQTRARVVAAARDMFAEEGFHRVSLDALAQRADVARATVYHQFGSKLGLLEAVVGDFERRAGLDALAELIEHTPSDRLLRATVTAGSDYWATDPPLVRKTIAIAATDSDAAQLLAGRDAGRLELLTRVVERLVADDRLQDSCSPQSALDTLWLLTGFAAYDELTHGRAMSTAAAAALLAELAERQIYGDAPA
jgi:AcrR family transcriptional regulator